MSALRALQREIDELRTEFGALEVLTISEDLVLFTMTLRGVDLRVIVEPERYPVRPPAIYVEGPWSHPNIGRDGLIGGLECQRAWNRTFGMGQLVRELYREFVEAPPARRGEIAV